MAKGKRTAIRVFTPSVDLGGGPLGARSWIVGYAPRGVNVSALVQNLREALVFGEPRVPLYVEATDVDGGAP